MATVLLVEDDDAFAYAASRDIESAGHRVITVSGSMAALSAIDADPSIDLLVTDIRLPPGEPHGFALANMARHRRPTLPVIYITAYDHLAETADETAAVLLKPLEDGRLAKEIAARLRGTAR